MQTKRPAWLKVKLPSGEEYFKTRKLINQHKLNTVCESARCPNIGECWGKGAATFMILGDVCTRACKFCAVKTGLPPIYDLDEPNRIASAVQKLGLKYAVITSVDRDDLDDGGAFVFSETIRLAKEQCPGLKIEVLIPDFRGSISALRQVVEARPDVLGHNVETVPRLYPGVRAGAQYKRSLDHLANAKSFGLEIMTKSSLMLGLGESREEVIQVLCDLHDAAVDIATLGQYLQPTPDHLPVEKFYTPQEFSELRDIAYSFGFKHVVSGPLVRSSYRAEEAFKAQGIT